MEWAWDDRIGGPISLDNGPESLVDDLNFQELVLKERYGVGMRSFPRKVHHQPDLAEEVEVDPDLELWLDLLLQSLAD